MSFLKSKTVKLGLGLGSLAGATILYLDFVKSSNPKPNTNYGPLTKSLPPPPSRSQLISQLHKQFDVLVIGGGAVGAGVALDAASRNLNVALLERTDFASGTSSKSTKMAHGGVRYLEKAIFNLDKSQLDLVIEALNERGNMLRTAPHLVTVLPIMIPVYKYWQIPYFFMGCKMYDWFAGSQNLRNSMVFSKELTASMAPMLDVSNLKASCVYHDGSFNDARMNSSLALTAIEHGATVLNYFEVVELTKEKGKIVGVKAKDLETGEIHAVKSTCVVNATGPQVDTLLQMDETKDGRAPTTPQPLKMVVPSSGVHVVLPEFYGPQKFGLLDPSTSDGRVMFFLPWQGKVLAGTTDTPVDTVPSNPIPLESEIQEILGELQKYLTFKIDRNDVLSAWSGIRPLVKDPSQHSNTTEGLVRSHLITVSDSDLVTISGGKWTTYREMAEETVNTIVKKFNFTKALPCQTNKIVLIGGEDFSTNYPARLIHEYLIPLKLASHLSSNYGTRAPLILEDYVKSDYNKLPVSLATMTDYKPNHEASDENSLTIKNFDEPFTIAELLYSIKYEYSRTPIDFLARRTRLAFLNAKVALDSIDGVTAIMQKELGWSDEVAEKMKQDAKTYIGYMGIVN